MLLSLSLTRFLIIEEHRLNVHIVVNKLALHALTQMNALLVVGTDAHREAGK